MTTLDKLVMARPELMPAATLLRALLRGMSDIDVDLPDGTPGAEAARVRLEAGIPALDGEPLLEPHDLVRAAHAIARRLREAGSEPSPQAMRLIESVLEGSSGDALARATLAGAWDDVAGEITSGSRNTDEQPVITLLDYAARPALRAAAAVVRDVIEAVRWRRGICPGCGAPPLLAELRAPSSGGERERFLRCGRCESTWRYPRVECPGCGTIDHRSLRYLHVDGEEEFRRAMTCDRCQAYVKEVAALDALSFDALLEEDLATVGLDLMAVERGFRRAAVEDAGSSGRDG